MAISENKYITVAYKLYSLEEGEKEFVEEAPVETPFQFISDLGTTLPAFERGVVNLKAGEKFTLNLTKDEAYGDFSEEYVIELPREMFEIDGHFDNTHIFEGNTVPLMDADGRTLNGTVLEVREDLVIMDMNHPLAGCDLIFEGEVVESRPATNEEIQGMINMITGEGEGGCGCGSSCGCGSNDDESGCGCGSNDNQGGGCCGGGCC